jgi:hypothetical protein
VFLASAALGVGTAYATGSALAKFWLLAGAVALCYALARQPDLQRLYLALGALGAFGAALALYFLMTNDWAAYPVKVPALVALGEWISAHLPALAARRIHPNLVGGALALLWPLYVPLFVLARSSRRVKLGPRVRSVLGVVWPAAALFTAVTWLVASSRGAWLGLAAALALWLGWRVLERWYGRFNAPAKETWGERVWIMTSLAVVGAAALGVGAARLAESSLPGADALANRLGLMGGELLLARDYLFTGAGLGTNQLQYSIYTLLIHVGYVAQPRYVPRPDRRAGRGGAGVVLESAC